MKDTVREAATARGRISVPLDELANSVFGAISDAVVLCLPETLQIVEANPAAIRLYGYDRDEFRLLSLLDLTDEPERTREHVAKTIRSQKTTREMRMHRRKSGAQVPVEVSGTLFPWRGRNLLLAVCRDQTEKQNAENAILKHSAHLERALMGTVESIASLAELRDPYTAGHERRVGLMAERIAVNLGLNDQRAQGLRVIGLLHDVGKIAIPSEILVHPGRLSAQQFELVKQHARDGYEVLKSVDFPWPVAQAVLQHHERMDGSGYPAGLRSDAILVEARIIAVADVVEAMASHRPYRPALGVERALSEIEQNRGRLYDGPVVDACLRLFREQGFELAE